MEPILHAVNSVTATGIPDAYVLNVDITDITGQRYTADYMSYPDDPYGLNPTIRQWLTDHEGEYEILPPPPPPPAPPYQIAKTTPWLRMTDEEAAIMDAVMSETTARLKQIYMAAQFLSSDDALWSTMHDLLATNLPGGSARADALLAPEG